MLKFWLMSVLMLFGAGVVRAADPQTLFETHVFESEGHTLGYRLLKPLSIEAGRKYPVVLFLHGAGERGSDNKIQLVHGMGDFSSDGNRQQYPCFVVAPQCPEEMKWADVDWSSDQHLMQPEPSTTMAITIQLLDQLIETLPIDTDRQYVTGLSMGGYGTWDLIQRFPNRFAAAVPVCGGADETQAEVVKHVPLRVFHGALDTAVRPERSRRMVAAIEAAGGQPIYVEYPEVGHDSWVKAYSDPETLRWLFSQKRPAVK